MSDQERNGSTMTASTDPANARTPISRFKCDTCGNPFSVCPAVNEAQRDEWQNCMSEDCDSYEPTRDADLYFALGMVDRGEVPA